jgi:serine/threonine-protein kinase
MLQGDPGDAEWDHGGRRSSLPAIAPNGDENTAVSASGPSRPSASQPPQGTLKAVVRAEEPRSRSLPLLAMGISVAALGAAAWLVLLRGPAVQPPPAATASASHEAPAVPAATGATAAPAVPVGPAQAFIQARFAASPSDAKILVDGSDLPSNPFQSKFVKDGAAHRVQAQAAGFLPQSRMVVFDKDVDLEITLQPLQGRLPTAPTSAPQAPAPAEPKPAEDTPPPKPDPY